MPSLPCICLAYAFHSCQQVDRTPISYRHIHRYRSLSCRYIYRYIYRCSNICLSLSWQHVDVLPMSYRYPTDILPTSNAYDVDIYTEIYTDARIVQTDLPPTTAATSKLCTDTYVDICETTIDTCAINYRYMYRCLYKYVSMLP